MRLRAREDTYGSVQCEKLCRESKASTPSTPNLVIVLFADSLSHHVSFKITTTGTLFVVRARRLLCPLSLCERRDTGNASFRACTLFVAPVWVVVPGQEMAVLLVL